MRFLSNAMRTLLESRQGIESILIVGIAWDGKTESYYADRNLPGIAGKIITMNTLDNVTRIDGAGTSTSLSFVLSDLDGTLKNIFDTVDMIFKPIKIYQTFSALGTADKLLLFEGAIASPIEWTEATRQLSFTAINRQFNRQVGFALDESHLPVFNQSLLAQPWPMIFGTPLHVPCLQLTAVPSGIITKAFGWIDPSVKLKLNNSKKQDNTNINGTIITDKANFDTTDPLAVKTATNQAYETNNQNNAYVAALAAQSLAYNQQNEKHQNDLNKISHIQGYYYSPYNNVVGGYSFPQRQPVLTKIGDRLFIATFLGQKGFLPTNPDDACPVFLKPYFLSYKYNGDVYPISDTSFQFFQAGSKIEMLGKLPGGYKHVASITPGTVKAVYAYRSYNGIKRLSKVPKNYYSVLGEAVTPTMEVTYISLKQPLSTISYYNNIEPINIHKKAPIDLETRISNPSDITKVGSYPQYGIFSQADWEDALFVTFESQVGPNAVQVIAYLLLLYTDYEYDIYSFGIAYTYLQNYPVNFALLDRQIVDQVIQDIAYQCRCAVWIKEGVYYIKYLSILPTPTDTITDDDIEFGSLVVSTTSSDDLITKYTAKWQPSYDQPMNSVVVMHNTAKYGIIEDGHTYFCFNNFRLVQKSATFWLIRRSNIWKTVVINVMLQKLSIETLDAVTLQLSESFVSNSPVICQVDSCSYNSDVDTISLKLWTGILAGEMDQNILSYPAGISEAVVFPLYNNIQSGGAAVIIKPSIGANPKAEAYNNFVPQTQPDPNGEYGSKRAEADAAILEAQQNQLIAQEEFQRQGELELDAADQAEEQRRLDDYNSTQAQDRTGDLANSSTRQDAYDQAIADGKSESEAQAAGDTAASAEADGKAAARAQDEPPPETYNPDTGRPSIEGDAHPSDSGDLPPLPYVPPSGDILPDLPPNIPPVDGNLPTTPKPIANLSTRSDAFIGSVTAGSGATWDVTLFDAENTRTVSANLISNVGTLTITDLLSKKVIVIMRVDLAGNITYTFEYTPSDTSDLGIIVGGSGDTYSVQLYPKGFGEAGGAVVTVTVPLIDPAEVIDPGTKISGIVSKNGVYYYQPPVWSK